MLNTEGKRKFNYSHSTPSRRAPFSNLVCELQAAARCWGHGGTRPRRAGSGHATGTLRPGPAQLSHSTAAKSSSPSFEAREPESNPVPPSPRCAGASLPSRGAGPLSSATHLRISGVNRSCERAVRTLVGSEGKHSSRSGSGHPPGAVTGAKHAHSAPEPWRHRPHHVL